MKSFIKLLVFLICISAASSTYAEAVVKKSSGIKNQIYMIEWCSPHAQYKPELFQGSDCIPGSFIKIGDTGLFPFNGEYNSQKITSGDFQTNSNNNNTSSTHNSITLNQLFEGNNLFTIEAEGIIKLKIILQDKSDNTSFTQVEYRIDKTAPFLEILGLTDNSQFIYSNKSSATHFGNKYDSARNTVTTSENKNTVYEKPNILSYTTTPKNNLEVYNNLHSLYYSKGDNFSYNIQYSDNFYDYLKSSIQGEETLSKISKLELLDSNGNIIGSYNNVSGDLSVSSKNISENTNIFGLENNSQGKFSLRIYDNSCNESGTNCNYTESPFYVVKDNTPPNTLVNSNSHTDILSFSSGRSIFDMSATGYNDAGDIKSGHSKFFSAHDNKQLKYTIQDTGIGGNNVNEYALYNAGIAPESTIRIESADTPSTKNNFVTFSFDASAKNHYGDVLSSRFEQSGIQTHDFSKVDNDLVSNSTYRYYNSEMKTNSLDGICDLVGNCINDKVVFRVVSDTPNKIESSLLVDNINSKIFADGSSYYQLQTTLLDKYKNKVVPVFSQENNSQIRKIELTSTFENNLFSDLRGENGIGNKNALIEDSSGDNAEFINTINENGNVFASENAQSKPDGKYLLKVGSRVPTYDFYPYIPENTYLKLQSLNSKVSIQANSGQYEGSMGAGTQNLYTNGSSEFYVQANSGNIGENENNRNTHYFYETENRNNYGSIDYVAGINSTGINLNNLNKSVNFPFASTLVYGTKNFDILNDGQYVKHNKRLFHFGNSPSIYNVYEKFLVAYNNNKHEDGVLNFNMRKGIEEISINNGVHLTNKISSSDSTLFDGSSNILNIEPYLSYDSGSDIEIKQSTIPGMTYDLSKIRTGFVSFIKYIAGENTIYLPSLGRNIFDGIGNAIAPHQMSRQFYSGNYTLKNNDAQSISQISDIGITGSSTEYNNITTQEIGNVELEIGGELNRYNLFKQVKENISKNSQGITWCEGSYTINSLSDPLIEDCTLTIQDEKVTFIQGNMTLSCGPNNSCKVGEKRALIVKDGHLDIQSDITTINDSGSQTNGQLFLGVIASEGLSNVTINNETKTNDIDTKGWIFIHPNVTNIDADIVSQGPIISTDENKTIFTQENNKGGILNNQLHIYGSLLSLNTLGGSRLTGNYECPYIISPCNENISQAFDLVYLRKFVLVDGSMFGGTAGELTPFHPNGAGIAYTSGKIRVDEDGETVSGPKNNLRTITDEKFYNVPLLIEKDVRSTQNPSIFSFSQ